MKVTLRRELPDLEDPDTNATWTSVLVLVAKEPGVIEVVADGAGPSSGEERVP